VDAINFHPVLSPDDRWLVTPLTDAGTSNLWLVPAGGGPIRRITEFGVRPPIVIARRVAWSPDSKYLYAALAECDSDVVLLEHLMR
jgi:hypothetical protein